MAFGHNSANELRYMYFGNYPASNGTCPLPLQCMVLASRNVNWRPWNELGPRQYVYLRSSNHVLFLEKMNTCIHQ